MCIVVSLQKRFSVCKDSHFGSGIESKKIRGRYCEYHTSTILRITPRGSKWDASPQYHLTQSCLYHGHGVVSSIMLRLCVIKITFNLWCM